ncbi:unnamed protein product [Rhizoctonia solani]|uniref:MYND-type domain-containing protein n=1 Tax=Rhizoctonia solani TaxID=456999 RepID=A0A8H3C142_9AGAM|nr:unnamed protein product [Rhizoctonia solani]
MLMALKPTQFNNQPWIWEVVDNVVGGDLLDLLDLALRVFSTSSSFDPSDLQGTEGQLFSAIIEAYIAIAELAPNHAVMLRFFEAGCIGAWSKCYFYFRVSGTENTFRDSFSSGYSINWACGEIIAGVFSVLMCSGWEGLLQLGSCNNPRCALPCYAPLICARCVDLGYCTLNCAVLDWNNAWGGPHRSVCRQ